MAPLLCPSKRPIRHGCQWRACSLVNFNQRLTAGRDQEPSFFFFLFFSRLHFLSTSARKNRWQQSGHQSAQPERSVTRAITALLIAPGVHDKTLKCPRLMFNAAMPRINARLRGRRRRRTIVELTKTAASLGKCRAEGQFKVGGAH